MKQQQIDVKELIRNGLFNHGVNFLHGEINTEKVDNILRWLTFENLEGHKKHLTLYINSTGGNLYDAFALIDAMKASHIPVYTVGMGAVMSAAFLIFVSGYKGHRIIAPNTGIMCHEFSDEIYGKHHDIRASLTEADHCGKRMLDILVKATGQDDKWVKKTLLNPTDQYFSAEQAIELGLADHLFKKIED
jgi:ATP-dependent Clp protease protease subunit